MQAVRISTCIQIVHTYLKRLGQMSPTDLIFATPDWVKRCVHLCLVWPTGTPDPRFPADYSSNPRIAFFFTLAHLLHPRTLPRHISSLPLKQPISLSQLDGPAQDVIFSSVRVAFEPHQHGRTLALDSFSAWFERPAQLVSTVHTSRQTTTLHIVCMYVLAFSLFLDDAGDGTQIALYTFG